jgi:hypothetical protein
VDVDVMLVKNPLKELSFNKYFLYRATNRWTSLCGTCLFSRDLWQQVGGYAEFLKGWGHDDDYFHGKLYPLGVKMAFMPFECFKHIDHDDIKSSIYHEMKNRWKSRDLNVATASLIRKVYFDTVQVEMISPEGKTRKINFPVQIIDKKEPIKMMETIYKEQKLPANFRRPVEKPVFRNIIQIEKTSSRPVLDFPRVGRK